MNAPTPEENPQDAVASDHEDIIQSDYFNPQGDWSATVIGKTPDGLEVQVMKRKEGSGYYIGYRTGKKVHQDLEGWFTTYDKAELTARIHINKLWEQDAPTADQEATT